MIVREKFQKNFCHSKDSSKQSFEIVTFIIFLNGCPHNLPQIKLQVLKFPPVRDICLVCYSHRSTRYCCIFDGLCASQNFLSPPTNCLITYLIRPINFPQFSKNQLYWMTEFCANFYISSNFFKIPNHFYYSGQRLALLKWQLFYSHL